VPGCLGGAFAESTSGVQEVVHLFSEPNSVSTIQNILEMIRKIGAEPLKRVDVVYGRFF
jgi:hypothetical protein